MKWSEIGRDKTNEEKVRTPMEKRPRKAHEIGISLRLNAVTLGTLNQCLFPIVILNIYPYTILIE